MRVSNWPFLKERYYQRKFAYTAAAGTYYAQVFGYSNANNATKRYTLKVALGTASRVEIISSVDAGKGRIKLYPNPVVSMLNITVADELVKTSKLAIVDAKGTVVMTSKVTSNQQAVNVSRLAKGIYVVRVSNGSSVTNSKFVKQ